MSHRDNELYEFGDFRLDVAEHRFERLDGECHGQIPEKAFQTLTYLVRNSGRLVPKGELIEAVWPGTAVEENNLDKSIHAVRAALHDSPNQPTYIETVRKHGYRFVAAVTKVESWDERKGGPNERTGSRPPGEPSISTLTTTSGAFVFSAKWRAEDDGLAQSGVRGHEVKTDLDAPLSLEPKRTARKKWPSAIAVSFLLLLSAGLLLAVYRFGPAGARSTRGTDNEEAYRLYLQAVNLSEERGVQNVRKSLEHFEQAVALDPQYALAWAGKAHIHRDMVGHGDPDQHGHYQRSMEAINKALAIDPTLSDAYSALCHNKTRYEYDFAGAEAACRRALELDPNSPVAYKIHANFLYTRGRFEESIAAIKKAMDLQPVSYQNQQIYALTLYFARRYPEAEDQFKRLVELNPNHSFIHGSLVRVLEQQGKYPEAFRYLLEMLAIQKETEKAQRLEAAYRAKGWRGVLGEQINEAERQGHPRHFEIARLYAKLGDKDKAIENLERAYGQRHFQMAILQVEPQLDSLRDDPRFIDLVRRVEGR